MIKLTQLYAWSSQGPTKEREIRVNTRDIRMVYSYDGAMGGNTKIIFRGNGDEIVVKETIEEIGAMPSWEIPPR